MPCGECGKRRGQAAPRAYVVKAPGQPARTVTTEQAAQAAVSGVRGARYRAVRSGEGTETKA